MKRFKSEINNTPPEIVENKYPEEENRVDEKETEREQNDKDNDVEEIIKSELNAGNLRAIKKDGTIKSGGKILNLGSEYTNHLLVRIDNNKFGIIDRNKLAITPIRTIASNFTELLTVDDDTFKIEPYSVEALNPKHEDESEENYNIRTHFQKDTLSETRIGLVVARVENELGVSMNNLSHREKASLAAYYFANQRAKTRNNLVEVTKNHGINGLKAFLACEHGMEMGDKIIEISQKLKAETAQKLFTKYSEITNTAQHTLDYLKEKFGKDKNLSKKTINELKERLLLKGKDLLTNFSELAKKEPPENILNKLDSIKTEIILFANTFRATLKENPELKFQDIKDMSLSEIMANDLQEEDSKEMRKMFLTNRKGNEEYTPELLKEMTSEFDKSLKSKNSQFYVLKNGETIVAFIRFEQKPDNRLYAGSFNVRKEGHNSGIGTEMMKNVLDEKAKTHTIDAVSISTNPALKMYQEKFGFKIVKEDTNYQGSGKKYYILERKDIQAEELPRAA